jgi:hypothetical protein
MRNLTSEHFDELVKKTRLTGAGIQAAKLYFVNGIENLAECGRLSGVSKTVVSRVVKRICEEMHLSGELIKVCYTIPHRIKPLLDEYVEFLQKNTK